MWFEYELGSDGIYSVWTRHGRSKRLCACSDFLSEGRVFPSEEGTPLSLFWFRAATCHRGAALFLWKALGSTIVKQSCGDKESMEEEKSFTEQSSQRKWYLI